MLKPKLLQQEQGFTLVEVLVAILITTLFVGVAMQSMVIAAIFKARAQEFAEATTWIQEDLENVKYEAAKFQYTSLVDETSVLDTDPKHELTDIVLKIASVDGFQTGDKLIVGTDSTDNTIASIDTTAKTITLNAVLGNDLPKDTVMVATTRCTNSLDTGFADGLRDKIIGSNQTGATKTNDIPKASNRTGQTFTLKRTTTVSRFDINAPYNVLQVSYEVLPTSGGSSVANFYTEVIPNAALQCP